jgi:hypothetical protein
MITASYITQMSSNKLIEHHLDGHTVTLSTTQSRTSQYIMLCRGRYCKLLLPFVAHSVLAHIHSVVLSV